MTTKLVIFDCDGTIVDSQHMIVEAMEIAFAEAGLARPDRLSVLSVVGLSLPLAVKRLLPAEADSLVVRVSDTYKSAFHQLRKMPEKAEPLYPGMRETILGLAARPDVVLGIATGKSRRGVTELMAREALASHFVTIQTADTHPSKPHPSMILTAMSEAGADPGSTVMIGDTTFDIEMARAAEVAAVGVSWGYHPVPALNAAGAHAVADTSEALGEIVARLIADTESKA